MSWEVQRLVWDLDIESELKFTALAYANFAKADGTDVYPSVLTIAKKTNYHERSVQRYKSKLISMGILIPDGRGKRGTNKFRFPIIAKAGELVLVFQGVTHSHPLDDGDNPSGDKMTGGGDIPSGDKPSGDKMTPESVNQYI